MARPINKSAEIAFQIVLASIKQDKELVSLAVDNDVVYVYYTNEIKQSWQELQSKMPAGILIEFRHC